jgi:hypothetical protein
MPYLQILTNQQSYFKPWLLGAAERPVLIQLTVRF